MKSIDRDTLSLNEAWQDNVKAAGQKFVQGAKNVANSKAGKAIGAAANQFANAATFNTLGAMQDASAAAQGKDTGTQIQNLQQKDAQHDQMDQQNTQTDQSQEQRIAQLEQLVAELQQQLAQVSGGAPQPAPAATPQPAPVQ